MSARRSFARTLGLALAVAVTTHGLAGCGKAAPARAPRPAPARSTRPATDADLARVLVGTWCEHSLVSEVGEGSTMPSATTWVFGADGALTYEDPINGMRRRTRHRVEEGILRSDDPLIGDYRVEWVDADHLVFRVVISDLGSQLLRRGECGADALEAARSAVESDRLAAREEVRELTGEPGATDAPATPIAVTRDELVGSYSGDMGDTTTLESDGRFERRFEVLGTPGRMRGTWRLEGSRIRVHVTEGTSESGRPRPEDREIVYTIVGHEGRTWNLTWPSVGGDNPESWTRR